MKVHDKAELHILQGRNAFLLRQSCLKLQRAGLRTERAWQVGLIAYCHEPTYGSMIVSALQRRYADIVPKNPDECMKEIETRFMQADVNDMVKWLNWENIGGQYIVDNAKKLIHDVHLFKWICDQNEHRGIAPWPSIAWKTRIHMLQTSGLERTAQSPSLDVSTDAKALKWMQRFRHRWDLQLGRPSVKQPLSEVELRDKEPNTQHTKNNMRAKVVAK